MTNVCVELAARVTRYLLVGSLPLVPVHAQELPTDQQLQTAFGAVYNRLGLIEYCAGQGFVTATDVSNARRAVTATIAGMRVSKSALAQQGVGRSGNIVGPQIIGLMDPGNPTHPEEVAEGQTMSLERNARAQMSSERVLCEQMAEQASAAVQAASSNMSEK